MVVKDSDLVRSLTEIERRKIMVEQEVDGLYEKYRVFREPKEAEEHPVAVNAYW
jgi:hypothetical protein